MNLNERMQEAYDRIAPEYTAQYGAPAPVVVDWGMRFLSLVGPGARTLDVGCGPGQYMAWMESRGMAVVGIDLSTGMLAQAKTKVRGGLVQMDMRRLAFPDGSFHGIWCIASLLHLPKAEAPLALEEMWRVLVPGGALLLSIGEGEGEGWEDNRYFGTVQRFFARYRQGEAERMLAKAGFAVLDRGRNQSPLRIWLQFLATKPPLDECVDGPPPPS
jgi:ubiquinone/menaquinone biosynthesis C-methylase UbiE